MPLKARLYAIAMSMLGLIVVSRVFSAWHNHNMLQFICYLALALMSSSLNIKLPGLDGTMSANFLFILIGIADLSLAQTMAIGISATLVQCLWKHKNPIKPIQLMFNLCGMMPTGHWRGLCDVHRNRAVPSRQFALDVAGGWVHVLRDKHVPGCRGDFAGRR